MIREKCIPLMFVASAEHFVNHVSDELIEQFTNDFEKHLLETAAKKAEPPNFFTVLEDTIVNYLYCKEENQMVHLVYCDNIGKKGYRVLDKILSGTKTMVVRGAAGRKIPHSRVYEGETLYFMEKGTALISAFATVKSVQNYVKLTEDEIVNTLNDNQSELNLTDKQKERWHKKCLCLVEFDEVKKIDQPLAFDHQGNMDDWLIIEKIEDVVVGTSIPYNYDNSKF